MELEQLENIVEKSKLSSTAANYLIAVLIFIVISLGTLSGTLIYKLVEKPEATIGNNDALKYLNQDLYQAKDDIHYCQKDIDRLEEEIEKLKK